CFTSRLIDAKLRVPDRQLVPGREHLALKNVCVIEESAVAATQILYPPVPVFEGNERVVPRDIDIVSEHDLIAGVAADPHPGTGNRVARSVFTFDESECLI